MAHQSTIAGWTPARGRRARQFIMILAACAVLIAWSMFLPWVGMSVGSSQVSCQAPTGAASVAWRGADGQVTQVSSAACISAYGAVHQANARPTDAAPWASRPVGSLSRPDTQTSFAAVQPAAAPALSQMYGLPLPTFWALAAIAAVGLALLVRNAFSLPVALFCLKWSYADLDSLRSGLGFGLGGFGTEMIGVSAHQWSVAVSAAVMIAASWFVLKVNAEQRQLDGKAHPLVRALAYVASTLKMGTDKLNEVSQAAART